ncbi:hypothetical protein [Curtobacterium sp. C2H10]|uniref:hypothetical protein n=1 Tax=Curtobacterium sp. C2H10 TaxID=2736664 RepID=UPI0021C238F9|nr:hypothetical protein [Curtobacterium sp. C2H10]MCT9620516.1 hypothetical protein [Curtobacterium sp. C2H10]
MAPTPSPSPSPVLVQLVDPNTAPVWQAPLLTGVFVLGAAIIAVLSLWWSDHRKRKADDQRQWDEDLKKSYLALQSLTNSVRAALPAYGDGQGTQAAVLDTVATFTEGVREQVDLLDLTAPPAVASAATSLWQRHQVPNALNEIASAPVKERSERVLAARSHLDRLLAEVRGEVRVALRLKP